VCASDKSDDVGEQIAKLMMAAVSSNCETIPLSNEDADTYDSDDDGLAE
jgi:hypothetical protein